MSRITSDLLVCLPFIVQAAMVTVPVSFVFAFLRKLSDHEYIFAFLAAKH